MVNSSIFDAGYWDRRYGQNFYYSYLFGNDPLQVIENKDQTEGNILIVKDSFGQSVNPFLALSAHTVTSWDLRGNDQSLKAYIADHDFDLVIVMYSETMIDRIIDGDFLFDFS